MLAISSRFLTVSIASSLLFITACSNSSQSNTKSHQDTTNTNTSANSQNDNNENSPNYIVAVENEYKPFSFRDDNAQLTGYDIDVLNAIGTDQNINFTYISIPFDEQFQGLIAKKYDIVAAGKSITDERKKTMNFSNPYHTSHQAVIAQPTQPAISDFEQLKNHTIAVEPNTISNTFLKENLKINSKNIITVTTPYTAIEKIIQNKADYAISDAPVLKYYVQQFKDLDLKVYTDKNSKPDNYGFAVAKNRDDDLLQKLNTGLDNIKTDGTYQAINQKWFGE